MLVKKKSSKTDPKEIEVYKLLHKITIKKMFNDLMEMIHEQNENLKKEIDNI